MQHCSKALTQLFAKSADWQVIVEQNHRHQDAPATLTSVTFTGLESKAHFGPNVQWPGSTHDFEVNVIETEEFEGETYDTVAEITGEHLNARVERTLFVSHEDKVHHILSFSMCSDSITRGAAITGCPTHSQLVLSQNNDKLYLHNNRPGSKEKIITVENHADCHSLHEPYKTNCNIDLSSASEDAERHALAKQAKRDSQELHLSALRDREW